MRILRCDICGKDIKGYQDSRAVQIRKRLGENDARPILEKTYDVCVGCIKEIFEAKVSIDTNEGAADDK